MLDSSFQSYGIFKFSDFEITSSVQTFRTESTTVLTVKICQLLAVPLVTQRLVPLTPLTGCVGDTTLSITLTSALANDPSCLQTTFTRRTNGDCLWIFKVHNISCAYNKSSVSHYTRIAAVFFLFSFQRKNRIQILLSQF